MYTISYDGKWLFPIELGQKMYEPNLSPDGKKIVFQSWATGSGEICVMDVDGGNVVKLTNTGSYNDYPSWSPDGTRIIFVSDRDGNDEIYAMNADGTNQRRLTNTALADWWPRWSPDGTKILYQEEDGTKYVIKIMDTDGTDSRILINVTYDCNWPSWSPDGTKIVFHSWADPNQAEIYIANADGTNITRLTNNTANDYGPLWLPRKGGVAVSAASVIIPETGKYNPMTAQQVTDMASGAVVRIETDLASGSGFLISSDGLILTANHMVTDANKITVYLSGGKSYTATVKARDLVHDLAL
jgi:Tol biopolymer transport system component